MVEESIVEAWMSVAWGGRQLTWETAQHRDRLTRDQPDENTMFLNSETLELPAFNGRQIVLA